MSPPIQASHNPLRKLISNDFIGKFIENGSEDEEET